jgi:hypothetical protein
MINSGIPVEYFHCARRDFNRIVEDGNARRSFWGRNRHGQTRGLSLISRLRSSELLQELFCPMGNRLARVFELAFHEGDYVRFVPDQAIELFE